MTIAKIKNDDLNSFLSHDDSWPVQLVTALPELLLELIRPVHGLSLERLQLTKIEIDVDDEVPHTGLRACHFDSINLSKEKNSAVLSGALVVKDQRILTIAIHYFMRGERKLLRQVHEPLGNVSEEFIVKPLNLDDIRAFFNALNQDNNFYYDEPLAKLNGRAEPPIPIQMILALMLARIGDEKKKFTLTLFNNLWPGQEIKLRKSIGDVLCMDLVTEVFAVCRIA